MSEDRINPSRGALAEILTDRGSEQECPKGISRIAPDPVSSFIQAALSSDGEMRNCHLKLLEEHASQVNSYHAWFDLGVLAHRFFFNQAAEEYYLRSIEMAEKNAENASKALNNLGQLYLAEEDWERACGCFQKAAMF